MSQQVGMNQMRCKVRCHALLRRAFSVADIVSATGLNPESVRAEIQRMYQDGLLTAEAQNGRVYRLTDNAEARLTLSRSVEACYPQPAPSSRPTSRHYQRAQQLLDQALNTSSNQRSPLLDDAQVELASAEQAEYNQQPTLRAYIEYERARLAYLRGEYAQAEQMFIMLRDCFGALHDQPLFARVEEYLVCVTMQRRCAAEAQPAANAATLAWSLAQRLIEQDYQTDSPITSLLLLVLRQLSASISDQVSAAVRNETADDTCLLLATAPPGSSCYTSGKALTNLLPDTNK